MALCIFAAPLVLAAALAGLPATAAAGQPPEPAAPGPRAGAPPPRTLTLTPRTLTRIARGLTAPAAGPAVALPRVDAAIEVVGHAPEPVVVTAGDLGFGAPAPGAPTHDDILMLVTPPAFRSIAPYRRLRPGWTVER